MTLPNPILDRSVVLADDGGSVAVLDRRVFPAETSWVTCRTPQDVAAAIRDMVTQSSGPAYAAAAGMALAAHQAAGLPLADARDRLAAAGAALATARPTNSHPRIVVEGILAATAAAGSTDELVEAAVDAARAADDEYRSRSRALGAAAADLLPDGVRVLTHCWMDGYLIELVRAAHERGRRYRWVATETRPYLQGARLTAHTLAELGQDVTLITDSMAAAALAPDSTLGRVDALVTAADRVAMDGSVANKVGTLGLAAAARHFGVPFYALVQAPDPTTATGADIVVEERDPAEVFATLGRRTASPLLSQAWYPAFDVTPPELVTRIVTDRGPFAPDRLADYSTHDPTPGEA
ncbi:s-methyl-5-thioribose-1-phosphate isomerase [Jiangella gansuensis]|uniref:s-methyl-5-thioribose-1-phosphate isomerase n=1 Tax=Jiangella gansuensis TaxID=281473 RepID=UPI00047E85F4|nr:s-methyl-5-thioribose-1-phosphate isomerase [Jiangella gansuensis]